MFLGAIRFSELTIRQFHLLILDTCFILLQPFGALVAALPHLCQSNFRGGAT